MRRMTVCSLILFVVVPLAFSAGSFIPGPKVKVPDTDRQRLPVASDLIGSDGRANPNFLLPNKTPGEFGQRLFLRDRNTFSWNASITKSFPIWERAHFQFQMSVNNVLNHPSWGLGSTNVYSTTFGVVGGPSGSRSMTMRGTLSF